MSCVEDGQDTNGNCEPQDVGCKSRVEVEVGIFTLTVEVRSGLLGKKIIKQTFQLIFSKQFQGGILTFLRVKLIQIFEIKMSTNDYPGVLFSDQF